MAGRIVITASLSPPLRVNNRFFLNCTTQYLLTAQYDILAPEPVGELPDSAKKKRKKKKKKEKKRKKTGDSIKPKYRYKGHTFSPNPGLEDHKCPLPAVLRQKPSSAKRKKVLGNHDV
jgi:hypothetical protein